MTTIITHTTDVLGGKPRIEGTRVSVLDVYDMVERAGYTAEEVADELSLDTCDVEHAVEYYETHEREMRQWERRKERIVSKAVTQQRT